MGVNSKRRNIAYGLGNPLQSLAPEQIVSNRNPTARDIAPLGQIWVNKSAKTYFVLTDVAAGVATWVSSSGGSGSFASVDITGTSGVVLEVATGGETMLGGDLEVTGVTTLGQTSITGEFAVTSQVTVNSGGGTISINSVDGNIGISTDAEDTIVNIGTGAGVKSVTVGSSTANSSVTLLAPALEGITISNGTQAPGIFVGAGDPNTVVTAPQGSLYLNTTGNSSSTRIFVNSTGSNVWVAVTTAS